jgi:NTE family protein
VDPVRVGLVLGAGGVAGGAWHAGVLAALHEATGWDARDAEVVVGTSAGSVTGAALRGGVSPADLHASATGRRLSPAGAALFARVGTEVTFTRAPRAGVPRPANPLLLRSLASLRPRPGVALAGLLPAGGVDASSIATRVEELHGGSAWPVQPLWIVAVDLATGHRTVFGRHDRDAPLGPAVAASCAIPGWFAPVEVEGRRYVDGGAHSTTNADLLADLGLDLVVVSAPMAGRWRAMRANPAAISRSAARVRLDREVATLRRRGVEVLRFQPGPDDTPLMDLQAMNPSAAPPVARQARESALRMLATRPGPRPSA